MNKMVIKSFYKNFRNYKLNMLLVSDMAFHKPVNLYGLFMMKIQEEIQQASQDIQPGRMGLIR